MWLAPTPVLSGQLITIPGGDRTVFATLKIMRELIEKAKSDVEVIQAATSLIFLTPEKDELSEITTVFDWVADNIRYQRDPHGLESVAYPATTIIRRVGDCDDKTVLLASLFESIGYATRLVMAGYSQSMQYEHVYCQVFANGGWINADATEKGGLGWSPPFPTKIYFER
jgi:transglutaminase-like putative cysteine protease